MNLTDSINILEVMWVGVATFGLIYGMVLRSDAQRDVEARHVSGMNSGREDIAHLLVMTATLLSLGLFIGLLCGFAAMTIPSPRVTRPMSYVIQAGLISQLSTVAFTLFYKQRVRRRVLKRDMENEAIRVLAAAKLAAESLDANTEAIAANTVATEAATEAIQGQGEGGGN